MARGLRRHSGAWAVPIFYITLHFTHRATAKVKRKLGALGAQMLNPTASSSAPGVSVTLVFQGLGRAAGCPSDALLIEAFRPPTIAED